MPSETELVTMEFKAITKPGLIKHFDLPGPMVRVSLGNVEFYLTPMQATSAAIRLLNLAAAAQDAE